MNKTSEPYLKTVAIYYFSIAIFMVVFLSPADLGVVAGREVGLCIGFVFAKEIAFIQIAHVTNTKYTPLLSANFLIISAMIFNTLTHAYGISVADEYNFQVCLTIASFLSYAHLAYYLSLEISTILGIPIFRVPREKQK